jgi:septum formation protein
LQGAGFAPEVLVSGIDEDNVDAHDVGELALLLAERKAEAVAERAEAADAIVIGCDSILEFKAEPFGKPASADAAREQWRTMRGRSGTLVTGHCVIDAASGQRATAVARTVVHFGHPTDEEVEALVATGEPLRVAGGFTIDGFAAPFIEGIEGDAGNVIGLSLPVLRELLRELDVEVTSLWA